MELATKFPDCADIIRSGEKSPVDVALTLIAHATRESSADILEQMWASQLALNTTTFESNPKRCSDENGQKLSFPDVLDAAHAFKEAEQNGDAVACNDITLVEKWITNYCTAMLQEIAELRDSTNWKWWREKVDKFDLQNIWVELVDILHFWMSACMVAGLSPRDVFKMYKEKNKVNFDRQESGYLVKDENDSRHLAPESE